MRTKFFLIAVLFSVLFISCNEEVIPNNENKEPDQEKPNDDNSEPDDEPKNDDNLKNCINKDYNPSFILNIGGVDAERFLSKGVEYNLICSNFQGITPGNAFKYASVVNNSGVMDFTEIKQIIRTAKEADLSVFGHTLCWHVQQRGTYFESLMDEAVKNDLGEETKSINCLKITENAVANRTVQPNYVFPEVLEPGNYVVELKARLLSGNSPLNSFRISLQSEKFDSNVSISGNEVELTTDWKDFMWEFEVPEDNTKQFKKILIQFKSTGNNNTSILVDDIVFKKNSEIILNSDFENGNNVWKKDPNSLIEIYDDNNMSGIISDIKREVMLGVLENWIKEMMKACVVQTDNGNEVYVKHWDAVNEPMSDKEPTELKSTALDGNEGGRFYWQEYLGKEYARYVVEFARKYYKEFGGNPDELLLFINDYGLEGRPDEKCKGLIKMIKYWESDGKTKIDGIGSQMHVTYSLNPEKQAENEKKYIEMLELLAGSGKLVKISELDMAIKDENGNNILTKDVTEEMHKKMSDYYYFIVTKYFEIIPKEQQYGITKWRLIDGAETGWRPNMPTGLWTRAYIKKPAYWGFANGLTDGTNN